MNKTIFRFKFFNMPVSVPRSALVGSVILIILGTILALMFTDLTPLDSLIAGMLVMVIHWFSDLIHQYGHFVAAKQTGKRSTGIRLWWILSTIQYPKDEGELSSQIHIRRAIGGPIANTMLLIGLLLLGYFFWSVGGMLQFLIAWGIFLQVAVFTLGALIPINVGGLATDGAILLREWQRTRNASS